jgi:hypothetical protein
MKQTLQWFTDRIGKEVLATSGGNKHNPEIDSEATAETLYSNQDNGTTYADIPPHQNIFQRVENTIKKIIAALSSEAAKAIPTIIAVIGIILAAISNNSVGTIADLITPEIKAELPEIEAYMLEALLRFTAMETKADPTNPMGFIFTRKEGQTDIDFLNDILRRLAASMTDQNMYVQHAFWFKCGSIMLSLIDHSKHPEYIYDTHLQQAVADSKSK